MSEKRKLEITNADAAPVPAFTCLVYVSSVDGKVQARVANLAGIEATASSEREALGKVIPAFKQQVSDHVSQDSEIPWIDPVSPPQPNEQKRIVPVHL